jgi:hypothetical protein
VAHAGSRYGADLGQLRGFSGPLPCAQDRGGTTIDASIRVTSDKLADIRAVLSLALIDAAERLRDGALAAASRDAAEYLELLRVIGTDRDPDPSFWMYEDPELSREQLAPLARFAIADRAVYVEYTEGAENDPAAAGLEPHQGSFAVIARERVALIDRFLAILKGEAM